MLERWLRIAGLPLDTPVELIPWNEEYPFDADELNYCLKVGGDLYYTFRWDDESCPPSRDEALQLPFPDALDDSVRKGLLP